MIYDVDSGSDSSHALIHTTLLHNNIGCDRGHKSPCQHEEVATRANYRDVL